MHSGTFIKAIAAAALAAVALGGAASAADKSSPYLVSTPTHNLLFGVTVTSAYISRGVELGGAAIQPWAELDIGPGFYLGYWGSNTFGPWENDLSVGYRASHGPVSFDIGYVRYVYSNGDCCGEIYGKASINPIMPLTLGAAVYYDPDATATYVEGNAKYALTSMVSISGAVGSQDGTGSWNVGASWAPQPWLTLDGRYWGGPSSDKFVVSLSVATDLKTFQGLIH